MKGKEIDEKRRNDRDEEGSDRKVPQFPFLPVVSSLPSSFFLVPHLHPSVWDGKVNEGEKETNRSFVSHPSSASLHSLVSSLIPFASFGSKKRRRDKGNERGGTEARRE